MTETIHKCPPNGLGATPCCHKTPFELPSTDRITRNPALVTCSRPVSDPSETLALIAEHRLIPIPFADGSWAALAGWDLERDQYVEVGFPPDSPAASYGPTIGDAVRACVQRIKSAGDGRGTE